MGSRDSGNFHSNPELSKHLTNNVFTFADYVTYKKIGNFVYTSGHVPVTEQKKYIGKVCYIS